MKRLIVAVLCLVAAACGAPGPSSDPTSTSTSASTTASKPADDSQAVLRAFETCMKAVEAKDGAAALPVLTSSTFTTYDQIRQQALTGTEQTLPALGLNGRLLAYAMRGDLDHAMLRTASPQDLAKAIIDKGLVGDDSLRDVALGKLTINNGKALARVTVRGEASTELFGFALEDGAWKFDLPAVAAFSEQALNGLKNQQGLTADQLFDQLLTTKYGPAKAADVRKPVGA
ncbi:hypothetical protein [Lentzea sp. NPDC004782]|uniref:hypothetical protein n=1 Tax=Lentzea sp. NPDC004782 TaxID=3154458 RepID=UPI0033A214ED